ncbi:MAG: hypothetical protein MRZ75_10770 [Roseburia sp.]|nr:hypothetical protein [Roseburia sp.]MDY5884235.1 hypothetical protein [Roseburia sp.]
MRAMYKKLGKKKMLEILKSKIEISDRKYTEYISCKSMESLFYGSVGWSDSAFCAYGDCK